MKPRLRDLRVLGRGGFRRLAYAEWGPATAERTVICVHGVSRNGHDFEQLALALAKKGARVIVPDLPGRGRSDWLASGAHYTDRAYTGAMAALIARLDVERVDWIGTSLGGHIGMLLAAESATPIARLVLNDFGARISAAALRRIGNYLIRAWHFETLEDLEAHLRVVHAPFGRLSGPQWRHLARHSGVAHERGGFRLHFDPAIGERFAVPIWLDIVLWQLWDKIDCPVFILRGADSDLLTSRTIAEMMTRGPSAMAGNVSAAEVAGCGHAPALMDDEQIGLVTGFLFPTVSPAASRLRARNLEVNPP